MEYNSFVMYDSFHKCYCRIKKALGPEAACHFYEAVADYGLTRKLPPEDDPVWIQGMEQVIASIGAAKDRYTAAVENGKKGGRKRSIDRDKVAQLKAQGLTNKKIAETLGCSESSIDKIVAEIRKNQKNLNVNENVNENVNDNGNVITGETRNGSASPAERSNSISSTKKILDF